MSTTDAQFAELNDEELFDLYKSTGDSGYFTAIYDRRVGRVRRYLERLIPPRDHSHIDDLIQVSFAELSRHDTFKRHGLLCYLIRVAKGQTWDLCRYLTSKKRTGTMPDVEIDENDKITTVTPFDDLCLKETREALRDMIDRLPKLEQNIIRLYLDGVNKSNIAKALGISPRTFLTHYNFALRLLKIMAHGKELAVV